MTKADIVVRIQKQTGLSKKQLGMMVDEVFDIIKDDILKGNNVKIPGFGNFDVKTRGQRIGRNPKTGEETKIPSRTVVSFKPSSLFKEVVNGE